MAIMRFKTETAAVRYYRARGWEYSCGKALLSRSLATKNMMLTKNSRNPDGDHMIEIKEGSTSGLWFAERF